MAFARGTRPFWLQGLLTSRRVHRWLGGPRAPTSERLTRSAKLPGHPGRRAGRVLSFVGDIAGENAEPALHVHAVLGPPRRLLRRRPRPAARRVGPHSRSSSPTRPRTCASGSTRTWGWISSSSTSPTERPDPVCDRQCGDVGALHVPASRVGDVGRGVTDEESLPRSPRATQACRHDHDAFAPAATHAPSSLGAGGPTVRGGQCRGRRQPRPRR